MFSPYCLVVIAFLHVQVNSDVIDIRIVEDCTTPNGAKGKCKILEECPHSVNLFANPPKETVRYLEGFLCNSSLPTTPMVCCPEMSFKPAVLPNKRYCGFQHSDDLMIDLRKTSIIEFPWLAAIMKKGKAGEDVVTCLGALITDRYVVTSGFCAQKAEKIWVRLGEFYVRNKTDCETWKSELEECNQHEDFEIEESVPHPFINSALISLNDIGLLRLTKSVSYSDYIRPICLPSVLSQPQNVKDYDLFTSGWDDTEFKIKITSTKVSDTECIGKDLTLSKYSKCITYQNVEGVGENCHVINNGAPVMASTSHQWYLEGVSYLFYHTNGICVARYTPIATYMDWIVDNLRF